MRGYVCTVFLTFSIAAIRFGYNGVDNGFLRFDYVCIRAPTLRCPLCISHPPRMIKSTMDMN